MAKTCGHKVPCGCGDTALTTPPPCNDTGDCAGESCAEIFAGNCIVYDGYPLQRTINGGLFTIDTGDRVDVIIQRMLQAMTGTATDFTEGAYGLRITNVSTTSFTLSWVGNEALAYDINAQLQDPLTDTIVNVVAGEVSYVFTNLVSGGTYHVTITEPISGAVSPTLIITLP